MTRSVGAPSTAVVVIVVVIVVVVMTVVVLVVAVFAAVDGGEASCGCRSCAPGES